MKRGRKLGIPASLSDIVRLEKGDTRNTTTVEQLSNVIDVKRELRELIPSEDNDELCIVPMTVYKYTDNLVITLPPLDDKVKQDIQRANGRFLYYARGVDPSMIMPLSKLASTLFRVN